MKELDCNEIQQLCLRMLKAIDAFAKEHHLTYYLSGGTLLGAVRHKGFIPWDDDMDLMMPRPDYMYLIKNFKHDRYHLSSCEQEQDYLSCYARLWDTHTTITWDSSKIKEKKIGAFVDIFPIDGYPDNHLQTKLFLYRVKFARAKLNMKTKNNFYAHEKMIPLKKIMRSCMKKDGNYYACALSKLAMHYDYQSSHYAGVVGASLQHLFVEKNPKSVFQKTIWLDFEDMKAPAPIGYDNYLRQLYGDYMQLPPIEKRVSAHEFHIYSLD